jgi:signal transduction histidine kinase
MRLLPDTITSRTVAVLLIGLIVFHAVSICAYQIGLDNEVDLTNEVRLAERLITIKRALAGLPSTDREKTAHSLSGGPLEVHWSAVPLTVDSGHAVDRTEGLRRRLLAIAPEMGSSGLIIGAPSPLSERPADPHLLLISMRIADASWANFSVTRLTGAHGSLSSIIASTSLMAIGVLLLSMLMLRSVTRPLRELASATQRLYVDGDPKAITVSGPREIRELAVAFNGLQQRVKKLIDDRTLTLAAISHDLKTPLTRAQLRVEDVDNTELRHQIDGDLAEMLAMVESTLAFLKGDQTGEPVQDFDLKAILDSICDDLTDAGHHVTFSPTRNIVLRGRHLALKRAFNNLIANAAKYATTVVVTATCRDGAVEVLVDDDGPGITADQREAVFQPFYRIEASRNRATGGTGLGLTVARTIIRGHGGDITLHDAPSGGLRVRVQLPLPARTSGPKKQKDIEAKSL